MGKPLQSVTQTCMRCGWRRNEFGRPHFCMHRWPARKPKPDDIISAPDATPTKIPAKKRTAVQAPAPQEGHEGATPAQKNQQPTSTSASTKTQDNKPVVVRPTQPPSSKTHIQDPGDGQWTSTPSNEDYRQRDETLTRETEGVVPGFPKYLGPPCRHGRESSSSTGMFTNAQVNAISGGTFVNVAHIYECDSPTQGGGPTFPIMVLGLQAVSFATRSHYLHCNYPFNAPPLLIPEPTSTSSLAIRLPVLVQEMRTAIGPLALWLLIRMWIQQRSMEHR